MGSRDDGSIFSQDSGTIRRGIDADLDRFMQASGWSITQKAALSCRIRAKEGHARTLAGQITVRAEQAGTFWTPRFGLGFAEVRTGDLLRVDENMQLLEGAGMPNPAIRFHLWIYARRPDVSCIVHTHPPYASALGMTGEPLAVAHMDATMFHDDCAYLAEWPGVPFANEEGRIICEALGTKRSILLAHHGLLTTGASMEEAVYLAVLLEHAAQLHVRARAIGPIVPIQAHLARDAHDFLISPKVVQATFDSWARQIL